MWADRILGARTLLIYIFYFSQVESDSSYERIGGTSLGGGTFWGLGSLLTSAKAFDELLDLASEGDHRNVDLLVKDIYGEQQIFIAHKKTSKGKR